jgi:hypothetical protein
VRFTFNCSTRSNEWRATNDPAAYLVTPAADIANTLFNMTCLDAREVFPELLLSRPLQDHSAPAHRPDVHAGSLHSRTPGAREDEARAHLAACPDCQREFAELSQTLAVLDALPAARPSPRLAQNFHALLAEEKQRLADVAPTARVTNERPLRGSRWSWWLSPIAGCALLALGFFAGARSTTPLAAPPAVASPDESTKRELVALREQISEQRQQLDRMTTLVGYSILQQQQNPANERLRDVLAAAGAENVNDKILDDLIQALTLDPSANVRLRALEALQPHSARATVRAGVLAALPREQNPLVQLELIDFVATTQDPDAAPLLEQISANSSVNRTVRDAATLALAQL